MSVFTLDLIYPFIILRAICLEEPPGRCLPEHIKKWPALGVLELLGFLFKHLRWRSLGVHAGVSSQTSDDFRKLNDFDKMLAKLNSSENSLQ